MAYWEHPFQQCQPTTRTVHYGGLSKIAKPAEHPPVRLVLLIHLLLSVAPFVCIWGGIRRHIAQNLLIDS